MYTSAGHVYSVSGWCQTAKGLESLTVKSDAIVAEFNRIGKPVPNYLTEILANGIRYSYQDFDVLCAAMRELYAVDSKVWERLAVTRG